MLTPVSNPSLICIGGEDHHLRIPFLLGLRERGFSVSAAGSGNREAFLKSGIPYYYFEYFRFVDPFGDIAAVKRLRRILNETRSDLAQSFDTKPNILLPIAATGLSTKVIRTINGMGWAYSSRSPVAWAARPIYSSLQMIASLSSSATVFQNRDDLAFFKRHRLTGRSKVRLISSSGIDIAQFDEKRARGPAPTVMRSELGLDGFEIVMTVTRLTTQKGVGTLLRAAEIVHQVRPQARFVLVGPRQSEGPFAVPASEFERRAPYVLAIGQRGDIPSLLGAADLFAFPTEYREGVPRVLLEAGLAGLPIVASHMPGCTDVVRDGWNGFLVPPRSPRALAEKIIALLENPNLARVAGARSVSFIKDNFALEKVLAEYSALYRELLEERERPGRLDASRTDGATQTNDPRAFEQASHSRLQDVL